MKWVRLSCNHECWVPWLGAFVGREVICPGVDSIIGSPRNCVGNRFHVKDKVHSIVAVYERRLRVAS